MLGIGLASRSRPIIQAIAAFWYFRKVGKKVRVESCTHSPLYFLEMLQSMHINEQGYILLLYFQ